MKKQIIRAAFLFGCIFWAVQPGIAQQKQTITSDLLEKNPLEASIVLNATRRIAQEARDIQTRTVRAVVSLNFTWAKYATERQFDTYPSRGGVHKSQEVLITKTKNTQCKGILLDNETVATPEVCTHRKGWKLEKITLTFANNTEAEKTANNLEIIEDIAYINVADVKEKGVKGLPFSFVPAGEKLLTYFDDQNIKPALSSFLSGKGVIKRNYFGGKRYQREVKRHLSKIQLGDAFVYQGRVVALVKKKINWYYSLPTEDAFALFRR